MHNSTGSSFMSMGRKEICVFQELLADQYVVQRWRVMRCSNSAACNGFCGRVEDSAAAAGIPGLREFAVLQVWQVSGRRSWLWLEQESKSEGRVASQTSWEYWELQPEERSRSCCPVLLHHHQSCSAVRYRYAFAFSCSPYS